ncbi:MAG TPA: apolipoprotein N-acyltransferase [Burkholderiales bacterium]|nr:apolipoprotein N-acyltransferase [Burkholderiales bacterium]
MLEGGGSQGAALAPPAAASAAKRASRFGAPALCLLLGAASVAGLAPLNWWWLPPLTVCGLMLLWREATPKRAALLGYAFGLGWFCTGISWVYISMHDVGGMPALVAGLATLLFAAYLALWPAAAGWLQARLGAGLPSPYWRQLLLAPAAWAFAEWLRGWLFTGFPWAALGYAHTDGPFAGYAPLFGITGLNYINACAGALLALCIAMLRDKAQVRRAWLPLATVAVSLLAGAGLRQVEWTRPEGAPLTVSLLQGNIPQELKFVPGRFEDTLATYKRLIEAHPAELMVLPETALPRFLDQIPRDYLQDLVLYTVRQKANLIVGVPRAEPGARYFNSVISLGLDPVQSYDKRHLVPFGEFIPYGFRWFVAMMEIPLGDFERGSPRPQPMLLSNRWVALNVCYEDLFGEEIIRQLPRANLLVNISNIAWFGDSLAVPQHLQISRMRALETGRPMLRATNTGATAAIDEQGRVIALLPYFTEGALSATVQARSGATPYVRWGNWPAVSFCAFVLALCAWRARRGLREPPPA